MIKSDSVLLRFIAINFKGGCLFRVVEHFVVIVGNNVYRVALFEEARLRNVQSHTVKVSFGSGLIKADKMRTRSR